jgi:ABC-2 type transport system ATP-binding protein
VLIDHGRITASGTPTDLKAQIGSQRVDVTTADAGGFARLHELLGPRFTVTAVPDRRLLSIPAPNDAADLATIATAVGDSGVAVTELALRRPTLDDAFLSLTGQPLEEAS